MAAIMRAATVTAIASLGRENKNVKAPRLADILQVGSASLHTLSEIVMDVESFTRHDARPKTTASIYTLEACAIKVVLVTRARP